MRWSWLAFAGAAGVTTACVVNDTTVSCPTKSISNIDAEFDDRKVGVNLAHYHHLNFNNITVEDRGSEIYRRGLIPHSSPHYGVGNDTSRVSLSIDGTKTTSFDLNSLWVGCLSPTNLKSGYEAVSCSFAVDCASTLSEEGHLGPHLYTYVANSTVDAEMMFVNPGFSYCQQATVSLWGSSQDQEANIVVDDVSYNIREGECLPVCPGCQNPSC